MAEKDEGVDPRVSMPPDLITGNQVDADGVDPRISMPPDLIKPGGGDGEIQEGGGDIDVGSEDGTIGDQGGVLQGAGSGPSLQDLPDLTNMADASPPESSADPTNPLDGLDLTAGPAPGIPGPGPDFTSVGMPEESALPELDAPAMDLPMDDPGADIA